MQHALPSSSWPLRHQHDVFIDGAWGAPASGERFDVVSAHSEASLGTVAAAGADDVARAADAARRAFDSGPWPKLMPGERAGYVRALSAALEPKMPAIERAWVDQVGALASMAPMVVGGGKFWFDYYADLAERFAWEREVALFGGGEGRIVREPVGVAVAIAPWNNPFGILAGKVAPALIAGCTVVMKPAPETPIEAYLLAEAAEEAGLPPGVLNLVRRARGVGHAGP